MTGSEVPLSGATALRSGPCRLRIGGRTFETFLARQFADLINRPIEILQNNPVIRDEIRGQYVHILGRKQCICTACPGDHQAVGEPTRDFTSARRDGHSDSACS
jgi:hypothetical protein